jgi:hypothetical protein
MGKLEIYEIPDSTSELFDNGESGYRIINYNIEMDNIEAMAHFCEAVSINENNIIEDNGTQIILEHPDHPFRLCIDCRGGGDFFSHIYEVSIYEG